MRPAVGPLEELLDESLDYWRYADRFGWLPDEVDRQKRLRMVAIGLIDETAVDLRNKAQASQRAPTIEGESHPG